MILAEKKKGWGYEVVEEPKSKYLRDTSIDVLKGKELLLTIKIRTKKKHRAKDVVEGMIKELESRSEYIEGRFNIEKVEQMGF